MALSELWLLLPLCLRMVCVSACPTHCRCYSLTVECGSVGLSDIPAGVSSSTQTLFLQDNVIGQVRFRDLSRLSRLLYLYLQNNSVSALESGAFRSQGKLLELALNGNRIHLVNADVFQGLDHLRILYLAGNQITRLQDFTFQGLQRLQELHLQENSVEVLAEQALVGLGSLALLDLSKNNLRTLSPASLQPLVSLQVLRVTDNPWRCDCALHWLRSWINQEGQRLLSSAERRLLCTEPPRLSHRSLVEVPSNSLVCIPPTVQLQPSRMSVRAGETLRVSCQASGYPQPQITWRKAAQGRWQLPPKVARQAAGSLAVTPQPGNHFHSDTGSGMLFLSNVTMAHSGRYECEAWNPGGVARLSFHLSINTSHSPGTDVSLQPVYEPDSMDFGTLGTAPRTAIGTGIALLALTALLLLTMIYSRRQQQDHTEETALYLSDYSEGPAALAQLREYRDQCSHQMYVLDCSREQEAPLGPRRAAEGGEAPPNDTEGLYINQSLLFDKQVAYEIHC